MLRPRKRPIPIPCGLGFPPVRAELVEASFPFVLRYRRIGLRYRSHSRKTVRAEPVEAFCSIRHGVFLISPDAALSPRPATHLFLLRQNKVSQKKATRSLGPCASLRAPCGARFKRGHAQTRCAQTSACPDPLEAPLLSPARTGGGRIRM